MASRKIYFANKGSARAGHVAGHAQSGSSPLGSRTSTNTQLNTTVPMAREDNNDQASERVIWTQPEVQGDVSLLFQQLRDLKLMFFANLNCLVTRWSYCNM